MGLWVVDKDAGGTVPVGSATTRDRSLLEVSEDVGALHSSALIFHATVSIGVHGLIT